ncbi:hypothetical protein VTK26DRAFT_8942 [Humicola hyalothermophila]
MAWRQSKVFCDMMRYAGCTEMPAVSSLGKSPAARLQHEVGRRSQNERNKQYQGCESSWGRLGLRGTAGCDELNRLQDVDVDGDGQGQGRLDRGRGVLPWRGHPDRRDGKDGADGRCGEVGQIGPGTFLHCKTVAARNQTSGRQTETNKTGLLLAAQNKFTRV